MIFSLNMDNLANHVSTLHTRKQTDSTTDIICNICEIKFQTKGELIDHIKIHKSYKLCRNYALNKCGPQSECRYQHTILPPGVHICYKCGITSSSKTDIIKHVKILHGNEMCHNFLLNKCDFQNCMFSHKSSHAQNVEKVSKQEMLTPSAPTETDFVNLPITGPVVRTEERAQPQTLLEEQLSPQQQETIRQETVRIITMHMEQMLPQILSQITQAMTKKTVIPK